MLRKLNLKNEFLGHVLTMMSGTALAQILPILAMPLLTRFYDPSDFGIFSLFIAISTTCAVMATARYELAIMLPKKDIFASNVLALSLVLSVSIAVFFLLAIYFFENQILSFFNIPNGSHWLYLVPMSVLLTGVIQALTYWNNRKKQFSRIAYSKMVQGVSMAILQVILGIKKITNMGLILGNVFSLLLSSLTLIRMAWNHDRHFLRFISLRRMQVYLFTFRRFPTYSLIGAVLDNIAVQMPIFMLTKFYNSEMTGLFSLTFRTLNLPMVLIAASVSQVLFQKITHLHHHHPEQLRGLMFKSFFMLLGVSLPFLGVLFFWGSELFSFVFGQEWAEAGRYASIIVFAVVIRFAVSPLSTVLVIEKNLRLGFAWQLMYFLTISLTLYIASGYSISFFVIAYVIHEMILYLLYFYLILLGTKQVKI